MDIGKGIAIAGVWLGVALACFFIKGAEAQTFVGMFGFACAVIGTMFILMAGDDSPTMLEGKEETPTEKSLFKERSEHTPTHWNDL